MGCWAHSQIEQQGANNGVLSERNFNFLGTLDVESRSLRPEDWTTKKPKSTWVIGEGTTIGLVKFGLSADGAMVNFIGAWELRNLFLHAYASQKPYVNSYDQGACARDHIGLPRT